MINTGIAKKNKEQIKTLESNHQILVTHQQQFQAQLNAWNNNPEQHYLEQDLKTL